MRRVQEAATAGKLAEQEADAERKRNQMKSFQLTTAEQNRRISEAAGEAAASNRSATKQRQDNQEWAQQAVEAERSATSPVDGLVVGPGLLPQAVRVAVYIRQPRGRGFNEA